jgi:hypothetical protein
MNCSTEAPAEVEEAPAEVEEAPAEVEEAPAEVEEAPAEVEEAPAEVEEAPAEVEEPPAEAVLCIPGSAATAARAGGCGAVARLPRARRSLTLTARCLLCASK